jgi:hypothetical protein
MIKMSETIAEPVVETEPVTYTAEQYDALVSDNAKMKGHMDTLLGETKTAKALAKQQAEDATQLANDKAKKDGDFEQLYNSSTEQATGYKAELEALKGSISTSNTNREAMSIAMQLADGFNAELLSEKIAQRLKYTDEGVKVLDVNGQLTVSTVEDLKNEFSNNERFASLLKGNQSSGGGASGGKSSGAAGKLLTRAEFDAMNPTKRMEFIKADGKLTN